MQPGLGAVLVVAVVFLELAGDNIVAAGVVGAFAGGRGQRGKGEREGTDVSSWHIATEQRRSGEGNVKFDFKCC